MSEFERGDALIRIIAREDPDALNDEEWAKRVGECLFTLETLAGVLLGKVTQTT